MATRGAQLKAAYSIPELAEMSGFSRWQVRRLLERNGLTNPRPNCKWVVFLSQIEKSMPELWDSLIFRSHFSDAD